MKIERFVLGSFIAVVILLAGLLLLGDTILKSEYQSGDIPAFGNASAYMDSTYTIQSDIENEVLTKTEADQSSVDLADEDRFWIYQSQALKAVWYAVRSPGETKGVITEVGTYLKVNSLIIGAIIIFIILSFGFAVAAFWKDRRP